jgi:hypothetical protein
MEKNLGDGGGGHVVLQGKRKIVGVEDTNEEEENGYRDMPALGPDVDLPLFVEGDESRLRQVNVPKCEGNI